MSYYSNSLLHSMVVIVHILQYVAAAAFVVVVVVDDFVISLDWMMITKTKIDVVSILDQTRSATTF